MTDGAGSGPSRDRLRTDGAGGGLSRRQLLAGLGAVGCLGLGSGAGAYGALFDTELVPVTVASGQLDLRFALDSPRGTVPEQTGQFPSTFVDGPLMLDLGEAEMGEVRRVTVALALPETPVTGALTLDPPSGAIGEDIDLRVESSSVGDSTVDAASDWTPLSDVGTLPLWTDCRTGDVVALDLALRVTDDSRAGETAPVLAHFQASQCE